jgi:hypothetical protein
MRKFPKREEMSSFLEAVGKICRLHYFYSVSGLSTIRLSAAI